MNASRTFFLVTSLAGLSLSACSLNQNVAAIQGKALSSGVRYEVRKALSTRSSFDPHVLKSVYFVLKPEAPPMLAGPRSSVGGDLAVRTTAYTHSEADHLVYGRLSATGHPLRFGSVRSAAADWSRFPMGTRFRVKGQPSVVYVVDDYGSALVGSNTIDLYCPTERQMDNWGVRTLNIEVLQWGSFTQSMDMIRDRVAFPHVRQMMRSIQQRLTAQTSSFNSTTPMTAMVAPPMLRRDGWSNSL
ncbi:MAG: 3d domain [Verrucomicrobiaceae bacterium]|nr:3d domain [Verrucomicrobiaceae bacterium]